MDSTALPQPLKNESPSPVPPKEYTSVKTLAGGYFYEQGQKQLDSSKAALEQLFYPEGLLKTRLQACLQILNTSVDQHRSYTDLTKTISNEVLPLIESPLSHSVSKKEKKTLEKAFAAVSWSFSLLESSFQKITSLHTPTPGIEDVPFESYLQETALCEQYYGHIRSSTGFARFCLGYLGDGLKDSLKSPCSLHPFTALDIFIHLARICPSFDSQNLSQMDFALSWRACLNQANQSSGLQSHLYGLAWEDLRHRLENLTINQHIILPLGYVGHEESGHSIYSQIKRQDALKQTYSLSIINSGRGTKKHETIERPFSLKKHALDFTVENVSLSDLCDYLQQVTKLKLLSTKTPREEAVNAHYSPLELWIEQGKATRCPSTRFGQLQRGRNCSVEVLKRLARFNSSEKKYKQFIVESKIVCFMLWGPLLQKKDRESIRNQLTSTLFKYLTRRIVTSQNSFTALNVIETTYTEVATLDFTSVRKILKRLCEKSSDEQIIRFAKWLYSLVSPKVALDVLQLIQQRKREKTAKLFSQYLIRRLPRDEEVDSIKENFKKKPDILDIGGTWRSSLKKDATLKKAWEVYFKRHKLSLEETLAEPKKQRLCGYF